MLFSIDFTALKGIFAMLGINYRTLCRHFETPALAIEYGLFQAVCPVEQTWHTAMIAHHWSVVAFRSLGKEPDLTPSYPG